MLRELAKSYSYTIYQWLFFFYFYCFVGWVWEVIYVSIAERKLQNRGFMKGPFLPIYGSGATMILVTTLPFREKPVLVFLCGMIGATLLELCTGIIMEKLFKVKYWDYSHKKFNFKGHICLESSIAWGVVSLLMMYGFHKPVETFVLGIKANIIRPIVFVLSIGIAADFATSFKAALDLRDILVSFDKLKGELANLSKKVTLLENKSVTSLLKRNPSMVSKEYAIALREYSDIFVKKIKDTIDDTREMISEKIEDTKEVISEKIEDTKEVISERIEDTKEVISEKIEDTKEVISEKIEDTKEVITEKFEDTKEAISEKIEDTKDRLNDTKKKIRDNSNE